MKNMKLGIIGCGNMGGAILKGVVLKKSVKASSMYIYDRLSSLTTKLVKRYKVRSVSSIEDINKAADIIIIAVKPQDSVLLLKALRSAPKGKKLFISVMAGVKMRNISNILGANTAIARVMPNLGAFAGESLSAVCMNKNVSALHMRMITKIFNSVGEVFLTKEKHMDFITALTGSGPAYFFYMLEALVSAAAGRGISKKEVLKLVKQTLKGSSAVIELMNDEDPNTLRKKVTSKGGTTEAAIDVFEKQGFSLIIGKALRAAEKRSKQLSR